VGGAGLGRVREGKLQTVVPENTAQAQLQTHVQVCVQVCVQVQVQAYGWPQGA